MQTADITTTAQDIATIDQQLAAAAAKAAAIIRALLAECAPTIARQAVRPKLTSDCDGDGSNASWRGIRFAGGRKQSHKGQGGTTWQWRIEGQSAYITPDGTVYLIDWDGEATDFSGCKGYMDTFTSEVLEQSLEGHLKANPESAQEIIDALRKSVQEDHRSAKDRLERMTTIIVNLK